MTVTVADQYGAAALTAPTVELAVSAPAALSTSEFADLVSSASNSASSGQPEAAQRLITALAVHARSTRRRRLQSSAAASVGLSSETARAMLDISRAAMESSEATPETRLQGAGAIAAILSAAPSALDGPTRIQGLEQLHALLVGARSAGVSVGMVANVMTALDAVLLADASAIVGAEQITLGTTGASSIFNLGLALLAGAAAGEDPAQASGGVFKVRASVCNRGSGARVEARASSPASLPFVR